MSNFKIDLSKFKKIKSDEHTSTLKHTDGHELKIAHNKLTSGMKKQLQELPMVQKTQKFEDGGDVQDPLGGYDPPPVTTPEDPSLFQRAGYHVGEGIRGAAGGVEKLYDIGSDTIGSAAKDFFSGMLPQDSQASVPSSQTQMPNQAPSEMPLQGPATTKVPINSDPYGSQAAYKQELTGVKNVGQGQEAEAQAVGQQGTNQIAQEQNFQQQQEKSLNDYHMSLAPIVQERQKMMGDMQNGHIDPQRYINNMKTGPKIMQGIGLILGGMGSGLTHGPNLAFQYLQNQIERDIDAQKQDLNKNSTLLGANFRQSGDLRSAYDMTRLQNNDLLSSHLRMVADQTADPVAKARLLQIEGMTQQKSAEIQHQMAMNSMAMKAMGGGGGNAPNPAMAIKVLAPPAQQEALMKDLKTKQDMDSANKDLGDAFEYAAKNNTILGKLNPQNQARISALVDSKLLGLAHASAGRFNMEEIPYVKAQFPSATDDQATIALKRSNFQKMLQEKTSFPSLEPYGVRSSVGQAPQSGQIQFKPRGK